MGEHIGLTKRKIKELLKSNDYRIKREAIERMMELLEDITLRVKKELEKITYNENYGLFTVNKNLIDYAFLLAIKNMIIEIANKNEFVGDVQRKALIELLDLTLFKKL